MRSFKTEGIIVRRRNFKDADRILTVLTKDHGKLIVRASGIRKIPSRRSAHVELLNHCTLTLYQGHAFPILTEAQTLESFSGIKEDLEKVGLAYYLCELVDGLCPENQENYAVFQLLQNTLIRLSQPVILERSDNEAIESQLKILSRSLPLQDDKEIVKNFQTELLHLLGFWNKQAAFVQEVDMDRFVETIMERKLKSKSIFAK